MKRYPMVLGATVAGVAGILSFHSTNASTLSTALPVTAAGGGKPAASSSQGSSSQGSSSHSSSPPPTSGAPSSSTTTSTTSPTANSSATGTSEQYGYGVLSVKVTVAGSKIADVQISKLQVVDTYSGALAHQVVPYLRRQVLAAQSAKISGITGATYTSEAYALSLQSALDKLHFK